MARFYVGRIKGDGEVRLNGKCKRCGCEFELGWLFHGREHMIDNQLCHDCYADWLKFTDEHETVIYHGKGYHCGATEYYEVFRHTKPLKVKVMFD